MKTTLPNFNEIKRNWYIIDANGLELGRLASKVAMIIMGKTKAIYSTNFDVGDFVIIVNAEKIYVTGKKMEDKLYYRHTGYLGGLKMESLSERMLKKPEDVIYQAVKGMLPKTKMGRQMISKLKVYKGNEHPHVAQKPELIDIKEAIK
jgi:large subunit ribosomal protein L13